MDSVWSIEVGNLDTDDGKPTTKLDGVFQMDPMPNRREALTALSKLEQQAQRYAATARDDLGNQYWQGEASAFRSAISVLKGKHHVLTPSVRASDFGGE